ncbi:hypothetical protein LCGC14_1226810 [marine sediment metagenome]|uniref:Methyltransferase domain-containing protein n=1 Tax=marine sediment metagenome TaxID=412755 RepID=A0A0F9L9N0_9ZZZZ
MTIKKKILELTDIPGWMSDQEIEWLYKTAGKFDKNAIIIELGCWLGKSTVALCAGAKTRNIFVVDIWCGCEEGFTDKNYIGANGMWQFITNMKEKVNFVPFIIFDNSWDSVNRFKDNSIDFIFIDADHSAESVTKDIKAWYKKIKKGGIMSGHDFFHDAIGVSVLTNLLFKKIEIVDTIWWIER